MSTPQRVLFVQLGNERFIGDSSEVFNVPLAAAYIIQSATAFPEIKVNFSFAILDNQWTDLGGEAILADRILASEPDILCFTCYLWNSQKTAEVIRRVKRIRPQLTVCVGGPEVAGNGWLVGVPDIDYLFIGEGELTFPDFLLHPASFPRVIQTRLLGEKFAGLPSPYASGLIQPEKYQRIILESGRGCTFKCAFCVFGKGYSKIVQRDSDILAEDFRFAAEHGVKFIEFADPYLDYKNNLARLETLVENYFPKNKRPEFQGELVYLVLRNEDISRLVNMGFYVVGLGLETVNPKTQQLIERKFPIKSYVETAHKLIDAGLLPRVDVILGLPGETYQDFEAAHRFVRENRLDNFTFSPVLSYFAGVKLDHLKEPYGVVHQPKPPYLIIRQDSSSFSDIQRGLALFIRGGNTLADSGISLLWKKWNLRYFETLEAKKHIRLDPDGALPDDNFLPVNFIDLASGALQYRDEKWLHKIARLCGTFLHITLLNPGKKDLPKLAQFVRTLCSENPGIHLMLSFYSPEPDRVSALCNLIVTLYDEKIPTYKDYEMMYRGGPESEQLGYTKYSFISQVFSGNCAVLSAIKAAAVPSCYPVLYVPAEEVPDESDFRIFLQRPKNLTADAVLRLMKTLRKKSTADDIHFEDTMLDYIWKKNHLNRGYLEKEQSRVLRVSRHSDDWLLFALGDFRLDLGVHFLTACAN